MEPCQRTNGQITQTHQTGSGGPRGSADRGHGWNVRARAGARGGALDARSARRLRGARARTHRTGQEAIAEDAWHPRRRGPEGRDPSDCDSDRQRPRGRGRPDQQRLQPRAGAAGAAGRHGLRGPRAGARHEPARTLSTDKGAARLTRLLGARRPGRRGRQHLERRRRQRVRRMGRLRREQSRAAAHDAHLAGGARSSRRAADLVRPGRHGHSAARCSDPRCGPRHPERPGNVSQRADSADRRPAVEDAGGRGPLTRTRPIDDPRDCARPASEGREAPHGRHVRVHASTCPGHSWSTC